jgi:hypothetical protein
VSIKFIWGGVEIEANPRDTDSSFLSKKSSALGYGTRNNRDYYDACVCVCDVIIVEINLTKNQK